MRIPPEIREQLLEQAREVEPHECCGMLGGRGGDVLSVHQAANAAGQLGRYEIAAREQFELLREIQGAGEQLVAIYHSHVRSPAWPSLADVELATDPAIVHVIVSLADQVAQIRAFRIQKGVEIRSVAIF